MVCCLLWAAGALADRVELRGGKSYDGRVVSQDRTTLVLRLQDGRVLRLKKSEIQRVRYGDLSKSETKEEAKREPRLDPKREPKKEPRPPEQPKREPGKAAEVGPAPKSDSGRKSKTEDAKGKSTEEQTEKEPDTGLYLLELLGKRRFGAGVEHRRSAGATMDLKEEPFPGLVHPFGSRLNDREWTNGGYLFAEQTFRVPFVFARLEIGMTPRRYGLRALYYFGEFLEAGELSGKEWFLRAILGGDFSLPRIPESIRFRPAVYLSGSKLRAEQRLLLPQPYAESGLATTQPQSSEQLREYVFRNPQFTTSGVRLGFQWNRFAVWVAAERSRGTDGRATYHRSETLAGLEVAL